MIKRSIITALALLLIYHFALPHLSRAYYWIPGQQRANYLNAQEYVHQPIQDLNVIVGSSMANELSQEILGPQFSKLTFPAGGAFTGLEIIHQTGKRPPVILIEANTLLKEVDEPMLADVLSPWRRQLREISPIFREANRPSNFQIGLLDGLAGKLRKPQPAPAGEDNSTPPNKPADPKLLGAMMDVHRGHLKQAPDPEILAAKIKRLGDLIDEFTLAGSRCVLFELPIHSSLAGLPQPLAIRNAMAARFPADRYHWVRFDPNQTYPTSDGIHLTRPVADEVTRKLLADSRP
jgi:hypothetical protein